MRELLLEAIWHKMSAVPVSSTTIIASAKDVGIESAVASVISELKSISSLEEEQRTTLKAFTDGETDFASLLTPPGFSNSLTRYVVH